MNEKSYFDLEIFENKKIPLINIKNRNFINAVLQVDSNYNFDINGKECDQKFIKYLRNKIKNLDKLELGNKIQIREILEDKIKGNHGSSSFWFSKIKDMIENKNQNNDLTYEECILGAIISVDRINSTHLEANKNARYKIWKRIINEITQDPKEFKNALEADCDLNNHENHILFKISYPVLKEDEKEKTRYNLSFASKFCAYATKIISGKMLYPKYDKIVRKNLHLYYKKYVDKNVKVSKNFYDKYDNNIEKYKKYKNHIEEIVKNVNVKLDINEEDKISIDDFDHIVWYFLKGKN
ncbi:hypothetical protein LAD74_02445 [Mycoplasma sp. U97]|uniref:hypothetical protein n=1 Tax=Mycoplasma tauri TaxID=547987 RepID=UPI001CBBC2E6|nr:hypothetical protein [Mycoplasma tauri]MBZ4212832.1 hypothetical protein [Mycoplasma tauri]